jgi:seryl-tRNA synthetase
MIIDLVKRIRENPEYFEEGFRKKGIVAPIDEILKLDEERRKLIYELDALKSQHNKESDKLAYTQEKNKKDLLLFLKELKSKISKLELKRNQIEEKLEALLYNLPNLPLSSVPVGKDETENVVLYEWGEKPSFDFKPKDYLELAEKLDIIDTQRASKVSGSRFGYLKGDGAKLEFALLDFGISVLTDENIISKIIKNAGLDLEPIAFVPIVPPVLIRPEMLWKMGYLRRNPKSEIRNSKLREWEGEEVYFMRDDNLVLVGTSEQSIGPMHAEEIFLENELPKRYLGFSSCFRREAGSYGKDTKGILRVHQFDKLEMFSFVKPEKSEMEHKFLLACEEYLMQSLNLPYRVLNICTGDLGDSAAAKYDIEAWLPGQNEGRGEYRETHSTSNTTDFQARRLNIRYRPSSISQSSPQFVHMLNGTALAMGRMIIAILENYQTKEGKVIIPEVLREFMNKEVIG